MGTTNRISEGSECFYLYSTPHPEERSDEGSHEALQPFGLQGEPPNRKNSLKAQISLLCIIFVLHTVSFASAATTGDTRPQAPLDKTEDVTTELETLVVTAKRIPSDKKQLAENVTVYTQEDIRRLPARDLSEVLAYIPAVDVQLNGQFGQATSLSINGSSARQVLLMVDGIPFNTQLSGQANPASIPLEHIDRIEIVKGASSSAWGSALGGVINVITKDVGDTAKPHGNFASSFAEFSTTKNGLDLAGKVKDIGYFITGSYFNTDGPQMISETQEKKAFGKLKYGFNDRVSLTGSFGYIDAEPRYALPTSTLLTSQPNFTRYGKLRLDGSDEGYQWSLAYKYNNQDIRTDQILISTGSLFYSTVSKNVYQGISLVGSVDIMENGTLAAGADFDWHELKSNKFLATGKAISMQAPYMNYSFALNQLDFIAGLRYDHNQRFGSQLSPSFGSVYHFNDSHKTLVRAKFARAFNAPPLLHLFNSGTVFGFTILPNPGLEAERANTYEMGFETKLFERLTMDLSGYYADIDDGIVVVTVAASTTQSQNVGNLRRQGGQLLMDYRLNDRWSLYVSGAFNDAVNLDTDQIVRDAGIARQKFGFGARYADAHGFGAYLLGYYNRWSSSPGNTNDRKPIFDLKLTKEFSALAKNITVGTFLNIYNLTNSKYWSNPSFPLPKRYFEGGFSLRF